MLFSDIRGFTAAREQGQPEAVVAQLNEYFCAMVEVLFRHQGTLDKFVGDMVMGLFGAPLDDPQHADHAVAAALEMIRELDALNVKWRSEGRPALDIGIGINSGRDDRRQHRRPNDHELHRDRRRREPRQPARVAQQGTTARSILISEATRSQTDDSGEDPAIGEVKVKGRAQAVMVYEVLRGE